MSIQGSEKSEMDVEAQLTDGEDLLRSFSSLLNSISLCGLTNCRINQTSLLAEFPTFRLLLVIRAVVPEIKIHTYMYAFSLWLVASVH